jgi:hypothetical protein
MIAAISAALAPAPNLAIRDFGWKYGTGVIDRGGDNVAASSGSGAARPASAPGALPLVRQQSAYVSGEIRPFRGDYRAAIDNINALAERLRLNPAVAEVRTTKMPLNVSPTAALSGNTLSAAKAEAATAEFEIIVVFKPRT